MIQDNNSSNSSCQGEFLSSLNRFETGSYRGFDYQVPVCLSSVQPLEISDLQLQVEQQTHAIQAGSFCFFLPASTPTGTITMKCTVPSDSCHQEVLSYAGKIGLYLYRVGVAEPLSFQVQETEDMYDLNVYLHVPLTSLQPGRYFLLVQHVHWSEMSTWELDTWNGHIVWPFRMLPAGHQLEHPVLQQAIVKQRKQWSAGCQEIRLTWGQYLPVDSEWTVSCYTAAWMEMGKATRYLSSKQMEVNELTFRLDSSNIWLPGAYFAVLSHNEEPYALISFSLSDRAQPAATVRPLSASDNEYWFVKQLEGSSDHYWKQVREWPGLGEIRPRLVQLNREEQFNLFCLNQDKPLLMENRYALVTAPDLFHAKRLGYCLPSLLNFGTTTRNVLDLEEWVQDAASGHELLKNRSDATLIIYHLSALQQQANLLQELLHCLTCKSVFCSFVLCGTVAEVDAFFQENPVLKSYFPDSHRFDIQPYALDDMMRMAQHSLAETNLTWSPEAAHQLVTEFRQHWDVVQSWSQSDIQEYIRGGLVDAFRSRLHSIYQQQSTQPLPRDWSVCQAGDIQLSAYLQHMEAVSSCEKQDDFARSMCALNEMVGLSHLKQEMNSTFAWIQFSQKRQCLGLPSDSDGIHHMIFTGNPGTGKTTVAQLIGRIYHAMGILSKGKVIMTERSQLLGRYIGETEEKMRTLLERARGNVLFIDEAYTLCDTVEDRKDFGYHVIESLLTVLAQPKVDMLVILAGYSEEMERLMQTNPGLAGRFPHRFHFADYSAAELMQIARNLLQQKHFILSPAAEACLRSTIDYALVHKDRYFSNARWIHRLIESGLLPAMAQRVMRSDKEPSQTLYSTIEEEDVRAAARQFVKVSQVVELKPRRRIGFIA